MALGGSEPGSLSELRAANKQRILGLLRTHGRMTQADIARASGLSPATVSSIARELREEGRLDESGDGGKRMLALDRSAGIALGIDFGRTHLRVAVADLAHTVLAEAEEPITEDLTADEGIAMAGAIVQRLLGSLGSRAGSVTGVGMGLPAPLRRDTGEVGDSAILPGWIGTRPEALMSEELGLPVRIENDANLGALAEIVWGAGRGCSDVVYIKAATGIGAGLVLSGRLYHGFTGTAGELGHITIDETGPVCRCGNRGCLETYCGAEAVLQPLRPHHGHSLTLRQAIALGRGGRPRLPPRDRRRRARARADDRRDVQPARAGAGDRGRRAGAGGRAAARAGAGDSAAVGDCGGAGDSGDRWGAWASGPRCSGRWRSCCASRSGLWQSRRSLPLVTASAAARPVRDCRCRGRPAATAAKKGTRVVALAAGCARARQRRYGSRASGGTRFNCRIIPANCNRNTRQARTRGSRRKKRGRTPFLQRQTAPPLLAAVAAGRRAPRHSRAGRAAAVQPETGSAAERLPLRRRLARLAPRNRQRHAGRHQRPRGGNRQRRREARVRRRPAANGR